jgi:hypothetical protein
MLLRTRSRAALVVLAAVVALPLSAAAAGAAQATTGFRDTVLTSAGVERLTAASAFWGGTYTAPTGEHVTIRVSDSYPQDPALPQKWANFLASLLHGPELQEVTLYLAPLREVQASCGQGALACYSPGRNLIYAPADRVSPDISAESIVMHEYGHHLAASQSDAPWLAVDWGTKRWSTYEQVCAKTRSGQLFPGDEEANYQLNPGEAFAETYRVLNERRLGVAESTWDVVSDALYPDAAALSLLEQDITTPWRGNSSSSSSVKLTTRARTRTVTFATPLDGSLRLSVRGVRNASASVALLGAAGTGVGRTVVSGAVTRSLGATVCGTRSYAVRLTLQRGAGTFRLAISKP